MPALITHSASAGPVSKLLEKPESWIQGETATDIDNYIVNPKNPKACKFCLYGAIMHCYKPLDALDVIERVRKHLRLTSVSLWNDDPNRTHQDITNLTTELEI